MGKQTKTIKCPLCGSVRKTEVKKDVYKCNNCNSHYFIDDDEITVNVIHRSKSQKRQPSTKTVVLSTFLGLLVIVCYIVFINFLSPDHNQTTTGRTNPNIPKYSYRGTIDRVMLINADSPMAFLIYSKYHEGYYAVLYDLLKEEVIKEKKLQGGSDSWRLFYTIKEFWDSPYLQMDVEGSCSIYKFDPANLVFESLADLLPARFTELSAGIANIEFGSIDAFALITNDGEKYLYSSYSNKLYRDSREIERDKNIPFRKSFYYDFTAEKLLSRCPQAKNIQLIQLNTLSQQKAPRSFRHPEWKSDCTLDVLWFDGRYSFAKDVTPDRKYFEGGGRGSDKAFPKVLNWNDSSIFIAIKASANPAAICNIQSIDINTGQLNWSIDTPWTGEFYLKDFKEYKDYYIFFGEFNNEKNFYKINKTSLTLEQINML